MKKALLLLLLPLMLISSTNYQSAFCDGFEDGFKQGYCYKSNQFSCIPPITPLCPLPRIGEDSYNDGYNRGFLIGLNY